MTYGQADLQQHCLAFIEGCTAVWLWAMGGGGGHGTGMLGACPPGACPRAQGALGACGMGNSGGHGTRELGP